jgi:protein gp37
MGKNTAIGWCDTILPDGTRVRGHTWNPWYGCTPVSDACKNCYMKRWAKRSGREPWEVTRAADATFFDPLKWKEPNRRVFTCSLSDFFHPDADKWRHEAWDIIRDTPHLNYLILTKRPEVMKNRMPREWYVGEFEEKFKHVWFGVTVEKQKHVDRILELAKMKPTKLFVSAEPLLEPIDFSPYLGMINWTIIGGESGTNFREMKEEWVVDILDQCNEYNVPAFMKQMSGVSPNKIPIPDHLFKEEWPE